MIENICKRTHKIYTSLPVLGSILDDFTKFLNILGYNPIAIWRRLHVTPLIDQQLRHYQCHSIDRVTQSLLLNCKRIFRESDKSIDVSATINLLIRYLDKTGRFSSKKLSFIEERIITYRCYLEQERGFTKTTARVYSLYASQFIASFHNKGGWSYLSKLTSTDIEYFLHSKAKKLGRNSLRHIVTYLRSFLRYLVMCSEIPAGIEKQVDPPKIYYEEKLPRTVEWKTVKALLKSVNRKTAIGKRDYAMLLLIATYGLRAGEVAKLKLENIDWRNSRLQIFQSKTFNTLLLPLTNSVGESIIDYLNHGRPKTRCREVFVRHRTPDGALKPTAISVVFTAWSRRAGLQIPYQGPHCIRHSFAVQLIRRGESLKTVGDVLGHRSLTSTCTYLRLNLEDLRTVPLSIPVVRKINF